MMVYSNHFYICSVPILAGANPSSLLRILNTWEERAKGHLLHCQFGNGKYHSMNMFAKGHKVSLISVFPLLYNQDFILLKGKTQTLKVSLNEHENF